MSLKRIPCFVAFPRATLEQTVGTLPQVTVNPEVGGVQIISQPTYGTFVMRQLSRSFAIPGRPSIAPSGKWRLWCMMPISGEWKQGAKALRWLRRREQTNPDQVFGPFTLKQLHTLAGSRTDDDGLSFDDLFRPSGEYRMPWVIYGDDPLWQAQVAYDPTAQEVTDDTEGDESAIFPP